LKILLQNVAVEARVLSAYIEKVFSKKPQVADIFEETQAV